MMNLTPTLQDCELLDTKTRCARCENNLNCPLV